MSFKSFLLKRLIAWDFIPYSLRWKKSASGIGMIYLGTLEMMQEKYGKGGVSNLNETMYNISLGQSIEILKILDLKRDLEGCAYVLLAMHRIFGIKSKIIQKDNNKIVIHARKCRWGGRLNKWNARTCLSIDNYEAGLIEGILPFSEHTYTKRRSCGDNVCELIISSSDSD